MTASTTSMRLGSYTDRDRPTPRQESSIGSRERTARAQDGDESANTPAATASIGSRALAKRAAPATKSRRRTPRAPSTAAP